MFDISLAANSARLSGLRDLADVGSGNSRIFVYSTTRPTPGAVEVANPLAIITLDKPSGVVVDGVLYLDQLDPAGDLISGTGAATWGRWISANDTWLGDGDVTDETGDGDFKIAGTAGTTIYAGGRLRMGQTGLT